LIVKCSQVVNVNFEIAMESAKAYLELMEEAKQEKLRDPGLFDAIVLAVARVCTAKVLTGDEHFKGLKETIWIGQDFGILVATICILLLVLPQASAQLAGSPWRCPITI